MTTTIKDLEHGVEMAEELVRLLAGARSTLHEVATKGKKNTQLAIDLEAERDALKAENERLKEELHEAWSSVPR